MEERPESAAGGPDSTREWLLQLERRVTELERSAAKSERTRRRSVLLMLLAGVLYILFFLWEMKGLSF